MIIAAAAGLFLLYLTPGNGTGVCVIYSPRYLLSNWSIVNGYNHGSTRILVARVGKPRMYRGFSSD